MDLIPLLFLIALIGVVTYLIITYIPMPAPFKTIITVVAVVSVLIVLWQVFGGYAPHVHVGK